MKAALAAVQHPWAPRCSPWGALALPATSQCHEMSKLRQRAVRAGALPAPGPPWRGPEEPGEAGLTLRSSLRSRRWQTPSRHRNPEHCRRALARPRAPLGGGRPEEQDCVVGEGPLVSPPAPGGLGVEDRGSVGCRAQWKVLACVGTGSGWGLGQRGATEGCLSGAARGCGGCGLDPGGSKMGRGSATDTRLATGLCPELITSCVSPSQAGWQRAAGDGDGWLGDARRGQFPLLCHDRPAD